MKERKAFPLGSRMDLMHFHGMPWLELREYRSGTFPLKYENLFSEQGEEISTYLKTVVSVISPFPYDCPIVDSFLVNSSDPVVILQ